MNYTVLLSVCISALVLTTLLAVSRARVRSLVVLFQYQSFALALYALAVGAIENEVHLIVIGLLILLLKVMLIPKFLLGVIRREGISERLLTYVRPTTLSTIALGLVCFAAFIALGLPFGDTSLALAASLSLVLIGFLLLIAHKNLIGQAVGFLILENGIFFLGLALAGGVPFFIEIGVMLDLLALFVLATALIRRAQQEHASVSTDYFKALNDL